MKKENKKYLETQLITYLGNKRSLLHHLDIVFEDIRNEIGKKLVSCDIFSGSGAVSRSLKRHSKIVYTNDMEDYAEVISNAYLTNKKDVDWEEYLGIVSKLNKIVIDDKAGPPGFIRDMYAPKNEKRITVKDRVFYTIENARRLDAYVQLINEQDTKYRDLLLAPLLAEASKNTNTSGTFKGFYKNPDTKKGQYGGKGKNALTRIMSPIRLHPIELSEFNCKKNVNKIDSNEVYKIGAKFDVVYLDPPYNQHPYGSCYFMLNHLVNYKKPTKYSEISGIPVDWNRSKYNVKSEAFSTFKDLISKLDSKYFVISFSDDGFFDIEDLMDFLITIGEVKKIDIPYSTFKGSRNLESRAKVIMEHIFVVKVC